MCDLFRNNRLLVEMRGEKEREKKEAVATYETARRIEPIQRVYVPMSDRKSGYIVPRKRMRISVPLYSISCPLPRAQPQDIASTLST